MSSAARTVRTEVQRYFPCCPFCFEKSVRADFSNPIKDFALCDTCGAKWHIHISARQMRWAELKQAGAKGGEEYLGVNNAPAFWMNMSLNNSKLKMKTAADVSSERPNSARLQCSVCKEETIQSGPKICPQCGSRDLSPYKQSLGKEVSEQSNLEKTSRIACRSCGTENVSTAKFCKKCGKKTSEDRELPSNEVFCDRCGAKNRALAVYCRKCGSKMD